MKSVVGNGGRHAAVYSRAVWKPAVAHVPRIKSLLLGLKSTWLSILFSQLCIRTLEECLHILLQSFTRPECGERFPPEPPLKLFFFSFFFSPVHSARCLHNNVGCVFSRGGGGGGGSLSRH